MGIEKVIGLTVGIGFFSVVGLAVFVLDSSAKKGRERDYKLHQDSQKIITAQVLAESYENTLSPVKKWDGYVSHSNETVKLNSKYTLKCKKENGQVFGLSIKDGESITKESLDQIIDVGSKISFPKGNVYKFEDARPPNQYWQDLEETYFRPDTQAGTKKANRIKVLE